MLPRAAPDRQYCIFRAGRERFCLSVLDVEEVVEWPNLTRVPLSPTFLMGIFNLRGTIVPVVDIAFTEGRRPDLQAAVSVLGQQGQWLHCGRKATGMPCGLESLRMKS